MQTVDSMHVIFPSVNPSANHSHSSKSHLHPTGLVSLFRYSASWRCIEITLVYSSVPTVYHTLFLLVKIKTFVSRVVLG